MKDGYLPSVALITKGKCSDICVARQLSFQPGTIVVMDRAYLDFAWFARPTADGVFLLSRPKHNMVVADEVIRLSSPHGHRECSLDLGRFEVVAQETGEILTPLTKHLEFGATTIAAIYKDRWQVELFFESDHAEPQSRDLRDRHVLLRFRSVTTGRCRTLHNSDRRTALLAPRQC